MQMHRWKITYQYPKHYEREFTTHFIDQKRKPSEIEEKHRFIGVIGVTIEEISINPRIWILKDALQTMIAAHNRYVEIQDYEEEYQNKIIEVIKYLQSSIHEIEGNIFTVHKINQYLYIESTNLHDIKKP